MRPEDLKLAIRRSALAYADAHRLVVDQRHSSALMFATVGDALCPASFATIEANSDWSLRTKKPQPIVSTALEMQSSNSSDGLLMSIFCHPKIASWKGISDLLGFRPATPRFGYLALVAKKGGESDRTEIDMAVDGWFVEAKLTEADFTDSPVENVHLYDRFVSSFVVESLRARNQRYCSYQVIRNILAAVQHKKRHMLLCDERRPDLNSCSPDRQ